jgi:hypothetical protein
MKDLRKIRKIPEDHWEKSDKMKKIKRKRSSGVSEPPELGGVSISWKPQKPDSHE